MAISRIRASLHCNSSTHVSRAAFARRPYNRAIGTASIADFRKDYFAGLLVNEGVVVEIKAVSALTGTHMGQALNYLFLCGLHHGTLLNFRTQRVEHRFVSTRLTLQDRRRYEINDSNWDPLSSACARLYDVLLEVLAEWGAFLDSVLYRDAFAWLLGDDAMIREIVVHSGEHPIGTQKMHMLTDDIAFSVTASTHQPESVCEHQRRFLHHTPLRAIQWINFNHHDIELRTIHR